MSEESGAATALSEGTASTQTAAPAAETASDTFPLSPSDLAPATPAEPDAGEKRSREIFRKLAKEKGAKGTDAGGEGASDAKGDDAGTTEESTATAANAAPTGTETPSAQGTAENGDLDEARDALIRDGWKGSDLGKLSPERIREMGTRARQRQQQQDGLGRKESEIATLEARLAELEPTPGNAPAAGQGQAAASAGAPADAFAEIAKELDKLGEYASPEVQQTLKAAMGKLHQQLEASTRQRFNQLVQVAERDLIRSSRQQLTEKYPALKDEANFGKVTAKMRSLAKSGDYGPQDMAQLMEDSARIVLPAASVQDVQRKMLQESRKATDGQMDAGQTSRTKNEPRQPSDEDKHRQVLRMMKKGKTVDEARKAVFGR